ncbi:exodeoxyribonuclease V subunit gamma [Endozoicomonas sp. G2_1]|uniref:exodeoxyribonuclease V subunit gamma n=1 Tax=Endozoicomonas sp. G2_1 TaxID=2821091 RepID=UPI0024695E6C|nr:exodeoxyribonuclease V subunit gamma [Endozoicomonas sp. G2_1]
MIYLYPANKMENLLQLLAKIQQLSPLSLFEGETIVVQNPGMQHWLNMSLAQSRGISMNIDFALPAQFLWQLVRTLASGNQVPQQSAYSREVLSWRIFKLLNQASVLDDDDFVQPTAYWQSAASEQQAEDKRYQLACQLADLYEQYLVFRPDWLHNWYLGQTSVNSYENGESTYQNTEQSVTLGELSRWQAKLWQLLQAQQSYDPIAIIEQAKDNLTTMPKCRELLPKRMSFFGINAMAPMWLELLETISEHSQVHFFHLNPCCDYWGDIVTEKRAFATLSKWTGGYQDISQSVGNPFLANLGQQGREFLALLQECSTFNIDAFDNLTDQQQSDDNGQQRSVLHQIQQDILTLTDARAERRHQIDNSIVITSAHSALREVQGLHDWLLHQFNDDPELTPKDVIVMCPHIEHYAPYVDAVFARGWQELSNAVPPLPCSIADRNSKDSDPLVAAFLELLTLPDSRFQVNQIISFLRLPAMQAKFVLSLAELDKISLWLSKACVHWGLNQDHKANFVTNGIETSGDNENSVSNAFTWQQGLERLLLGFAYGDQADIYQQQLVLPDVEGQDALLLGKLMLILEQLQNFSAGLAKARTASQWQQYLLEMLSQLFTDDDSLDGEVRVSQSLLMINQAIEHLVDYCQDAEFDDVISLAVVVNFLSGQFSQPDPGRQFMIGQVTFCSMLPMRSIPFKLIAVLGLNDGEFPRQRQPLSFDLMASTPARIGDRSRRGDDRYLFLEAIISARKSLYLSYQGRSIKTNTEKQPSLVLKELLEYLTYGYGWCFDSSLEQGGSLTQLRQLPMQAYSESNYIPVAADHSGIINTDKSLLVTRDYLGSCHYPSFDANWLALGQTKESNWQRPNLADYVNQSSAIDTFEQGGNTPVDNQAVTNIELSLNQLIAFFQHPSRAFARAQLQLNLAIEGTELSDDEPFGFEPLASYQTRLGFVEEALTRELEQELGAPTNDVACAVSGHRLIDHALLSGVFPDSPNTEQVLTSWQDDSQLFAQLITEQEVNATETLHFSLPVSLKLNISEESAEHGELAADSGQAFHILLECKIPINTASNQTVHSRSSSAKIKDMMILYCQQLAVSCVNRLSQQNSVKLDHDVAEKLKQISGTTGLYFDTKSQRPVKYTVNEQSLLNQATSSDDNSQPDIDNSASSCVLELLKTWLKYYVIGQYQPLLLNANLGQKVLTSKSFEQADCQHYWQDDGGFAGMPANAPKDDPYLNYFWPQCPELSEFQAPLTELYQPLLTSLEKQNLTFSRERAGGQP